MARREAGLAAWSLLSVLLMSLLGCGTQPQALTPIKSAFSEFTTSTAPLWVAKDKGFFARQGLDVHLERAAGPAQMASLGTGELQLSSVGAPEIISADLNGGALALLASASDFPIMSLYVNPSIKRFNDLEGKTVGVAQAGAITDTYFHLLIDRNGLSGKVDSTQLGSIPAVLAGLQAGKVTGGMVSPPATRQAAEAGFVELVNGITLGVPYANANIVATRAYVQSHQDVVRRYLAAYQEAWTFCGDPKNKAEVVDILARNQQSTPAIAEASYNETFPVWSGKKVPSVNPEGVANTLKYVKAPGARDADPAQFIDNSFWTR